MLTIDPAADKGRGFEGICLGRHLEGRQNRGLTVYCHNITVYCHEEIFDADRIFELKYLHHIAQNLCPT